MDNCNLFVRWHGSECGADAYCMEEVELARHFLVRFQLARQQAGKVTALSSWLRTLGLIVNCHGHQKPVRT